MEQQNTGKKQKNHMQKCCVPREMIVQVPAGFQDSPLRALNVQTVAGFTEKGLGSFLIQYCPLLIVVVVRYTLLSLFPRALRQQ